MQKNSKKVEKNKQKRVGERVEDVWSGGAGGCALHVNASEHISLKQKGFRPFKLKGTKNETYHVVRMRRHDDVHVLQQRFAGTHAIDG